MHLTLADFFPVLNQVEQETQAEMDRVKAQVAALEAEKQAWEAEKAKLNAEVERANAISNNPEFAALVQKYDDLRALITAARPDLPLVSTAATAATAPPAAAAAATAAAAAAGPSTSTGKPQNLNPSVKLTAPQFLEKSDPEDFSGYYKYYCRFYKDATPFAVLLSACQKHAEASGWVLNLSAADPEVEKASAEDS